MQEQQSQDRVRPQPAQGQTIMVRVARLGDSVREIEVAEGATLQEVLASLAIPTGADVRLNGKSAQAHDILHMGDLITVVPRIRGGATEGDPLLSIWKKRKIFRPEFCLHQQRSSER